MLWNEECFVLEDLQESTRMHVFVEVGWVGFVVNVELEVIGSSANGEI